MGVHPDSGSERTGLPRGVLRKSGSSGVRRGPRASLGRDHLLRRPALARRLNVWLRSQGLNPLLDEEGRNVVDPSPEAAEADVSILEAANLTFVSEATMRHWVETGQARSRMEPRIPVAEVERLLTEHGGPPEG